MARPALPSLNAEKEFLQRDTTKEVFPDTKEQLDLSNLFEEVMHHHTSKAEEKELVP